MSARKPGKEPKLRVIQPRRRPDESSFPLEQPIRVRYIVVGREKWQEKSIPASAARPDERVIVRSALDLDPMFHYFADQKLLAQDTETSGPNEEDGLDPVSKTSKIVLYQIGTEDLVYIVEPDLLAVDGRFKAMLEGTQNLFLLQNAVHDFKFVLMKYGIHFGRIYCTMLAEQILTAGKEGVKVGLSELARKYPPYRYIRKTVRTDFIRHSGSFTREQLYYGARDVMLLPAIAKGQIAQIKQLNLTAVAKDEFDSIPVTAEMELGGVYLEQERISLTKAYYLKESARVEREVDEIFNHELRRLGLVEIDLLGERVEHVDLASPAQKMEALKKIGIYVEDVQRETLEALMHPIGQPMADYLAFQKIISTYCDGLVAKVHPDTGLVHPKFNQHGRGDRDSSGDDGKANIATGRYSGDMQQLPRPEKIFDEVTNPEEIAQVHARWPERFALAA